MVLSSEQGYWMAPQGFQRVAEALEKDVAATAQRYEELVSAGVSAGWLDAGLADAEPSTQMSATGGLANSTPELKVGTSRNRGVLGNAI